MSRIEQLMTIVAGGGRVFRDGQGAIARSANGQPDIRTSAAMFKRLCYIAARQPDRFVVVDGCSVESVQHVTAVR